MTPVPVSSPSSNTATPFLTTDGTRNRRILVIDDNVAIHDDVRKILCPRVNAATSELNALEAELLGSSAKQPRRELPQFEIDSAYQGQEGLARVERALADGRPYAMAIVDVRMPPGWDGVETTRRLWRVQPDLQIVICTAYADYSWEQMLESLTGSDRFVILRKPFDSIEVLQFACALTEKWNLEQATTRHAERLEEKVRRRTAALEEANATLQAEIARRQAIQTDLIRAKIAAESADRAKSAFLANMSHEVRTPMNGVLGMANLLSTTELNPQQRDFVQTISACSDSLLTIINDILDLSKIEAGKMELESIEFNLREAVHMAADLQSQAAQRKNLTLAVEIASDVPPLVRGDPVRLRQVFFNLVANAVKFTERGQVAIRLYRLPSSSPEAVKVRFEVSDTGIGIPAHVQTTLFQPFVQADATTTRRYGGTGLGLAISKRIVDLMGGQIGVISAPQEGSRFWLTVEFRTADDAVMPEPTLQVPQSAPVRGSLAVAPVLVAEDNPLNQKVVALMLRGMGYEFRVVPNGREALVALRQRPYSVVLMDEHMPEMDGVDATREIRRLSASGELPLNRDIPIVATTADAMSESRDRCLNAGMDVFLPKPIRKDELQALLARYARSAPAAARAIA